jgi:hypothetical protein
MYRPPWVCKSIFASWSRTVCCNVSGPIRVARKLKAIDVIDILSDRATPTGSAGHASATASLKLTFDKRL